MITPSHADGFHVGVDGGFQIDGGIADEITVFRIDSGGLGNEEGSGGVGLVTHSILLAEDFGEMDVGKDGLHHGDGEVMGFVGKHGERMAGSLEFVEKIVNARIGASAGVPTEFVVFLEKGNEGIDVHGIVDWMGSALDEHAQSIPDEGADHRFRVPGQAVGGQGAVERAGNAGQGIHEGAVEIENETRLHAAKLARSVAQGKRLKPDE